ncbi:hypothetical protein KORDIASMS9_03539 [Kordia sp. SMS9]|uniref:hypothetical protein n=1 Tax=Kordia sp. SMS9 TaxID=2282170 RepID=UPI000E0D38DB|nr:hypothetical protein [Kordia sp. SMS9]AXG71282.1 hypothetical protein KORDIASMS9_03539 [Kordia sp. SMS9]
MKSIYSKITKWYRDKKELKKSNFGRNYGWFIEYEDKVVGELSNFNYAADYDVIAYKGFEDLVYDESIWMNQSFKLQNKVYKQYCDTWYTGIYPGNLMKYKTLRFRYLWINKL